MFTDEQRAQIRAEMLERNTAPAPPTRIEIVNQPDPVKFPEIGFPEYPEFPDLAPALKEIAKAVDGVDGKAVATAITRAIGQLTGVPDAIDRLHLSVKGLEVAVKAIGTADMDTVTKAIEANTKALNRLCTTMAQPRLLLFDDDARVIGVQVGPDK